VVTIQSCHAARRGKLFRKIAFKLLGSCKVVVAIVFARQIGLQSVHTITTKELMTEAMILSFHLQS